MPEKAKALPAKEFFISMLTRDISLEDCILDLLDNSVDGARRSARSKGQDDLSGFTVHLKLKPDEFAIDDNCGGISLADAREYAFNFGRRKDAPPVSHESIGIYGIGMKRALFKLGRTINITSSTGHESFSTDIDVPAWEAEEAWEFDLVTELPLEPPGTEIAVHDLNAGIGEELVDTPFQKKLARAISRGYALFIKKGLSIHLNDERIDAQHFELLVGGNFAPFRTSYSDEGVRVEITAGMATPPAKDESADAKIPHYHMYGWYVVCNDRVVLAGDKSNRTIWGVGRFNAWHNQYNGFVGVISFHSTQNPAALPWTTTKRDLDLSNPLYRRALVRMKKATEPYLKYTNVRKDQEKRVEELEESTKPVPIEDVQPNEEMRVPQLEPLTAEKGNVLYRKSKARLRAAAVALGNRNMSYKEVGSRTFEYHYKREVGED